MCRKHTTECFLARATTGSTPIEAVDVCCVEQGDSKINCSRDEAGIHCIRLPGEPPEAESDSADAD